MIFYIVEINCILHFNAFGLQQHGYLFLQEMNIFNRDFGLFYCNYLIFIHLGYAESFCKFFYLDFHSHLYNLYSFRN